MSKDIYDERKRIEAENKLRYAKQEALRLDRHNKEEEFSALLMEAVRQFVTGKAVFVTRADEMGGATITHFQMTNPETVR